MAAFGADVDSMRCEPFLLEFGRAGDASFQPVVMYPHVLHLR
jgi:hypothetical protein